MILRRKLIHIRIRRKTTGEASPVSERGDDKTRRVAQVLVRVAELGVTDVSKTVVLALVPAMAQLGQPGKALSVLYFGTDEFGHYITGVHINGTDGHNLLTITLRQLTNQHLDERIQLLDLVGRRRNLDNKGGFRNTYYET